MAGGKAGTLARLSQAGYPVPDGFVILPTVFAAVEMVPQAWKQVQAHVEKMRSGDQDIAFAVRSSNTIVGFAGAAGHREGRVRCLNNPEAGNQLQPGEILVAVTTNIGWTSLFPRAAAIVTDVGAPLSHAAIVARELGIPAVVGCGSAILRLQTGDRVLVDGGQGIVKILERY